MTTTTLSIKDGGANSKTLAVEDNGAAGLTPYHLEDMGQRSALLAVLNTHAAAAQLPASLGSKTAANSLAVTLATDGQFVTMQTAANASLAGIQTALALVKTNIVDSSGATRQISGVNVNSSSPNVALSAASDGTTNPTTGISAVARVRGDFNVSTRCSGDWSGQFIIERKFTAAAGTNWHPLTALGTALVFTGSLSETFNEPQDGVDYRIRVTSWTAGTMTYRIGQ